MNEAHNNAELAQQLADLLLDFSKTTQKEFEEIYGMINDAKKSGVLEDTVHDEIVNMAKFEMAYSELVDRNCIDLASRMQSYLFDLNKKLIEYNNIKI